MEVLEENKGRLSSSRTYEKSKKAVNGLIELSSDGTSKIELIIDALLYRCEDITPLALQKALYYIQGFYYAFIKEFLFEDDCEAWVHGPVYRDVYKKYKEYRFDPIDEKRKFNEAALSETEKVFVESIVRNIRYFL